MNEDRGYQERYCAFVDILGFREIIATLEADPTKYREIRQLLKEIHVPPRTSDEILKGSDLRAQSISDAVAISTDCSPPGLLHLLFLLEHLATDLLNKGFLIRGAIVKGRLYHDDSMVFGEALVRAAHLEQEVVRFPRIMITSDVVRDVEAYCKGNEPWRSHFVDALRQAEDGPMYLHVLRFPVKAIGDELRRSTDASPADSAALKYYAQMGRELQRRLDVAIDNPRHFEKIRWFAIYWNSTMPNNVLGLGAGVRLQIGHAEGANSIAR